MNEPDEQYGWDALSAWAESDELELPGQGVYGAQAAIEGCEAIRKALAEDGEDKPADNPTD
ncbi:hypothetical protein [Bifidobacterium callitrichidarum]|uniref:Uncharacterized protein n=1 Tax=Bifidobacterium callitrichidarum TaxID=2052941 RepID=A0A2U2NC86_9BIFI|nr:hypothetical protein [Bifidobacterium callitrichidarum]PWG66766.1 hypothetical protein DF196_02365 [Bifidobacterium callitrichidarum]